MLIDKSKHKEDASGHPGAEAALNPPDGGWGWMVVFGSFMIHLIADGMAYSFGVYVESFLEEFGATRSQVGFLGSLMLGVTWASGPIASMLTNKYGCRVVAIVGTVIAAFGFFISIFAPNIYFMFFSFGIVAGIGLGFAYLPAIVAVSFYFEKRRSLATGLAVCGSGFGTFIFAPLTELLLQEYGWKGTVLIETALLLNCIPCGAVFRPLQTTASVPLADQAERSDAPVELKQFKANGNDPLTVSSSHSALPPPSKSNSDPEAGRKNEFSSERQLHTHSNENAPKPVGPMNRKDIFYTGSIQNLDAFKSDPDLYKQSVLSIPRQSSETSSSSSSCWCCAPFKRLCGPDTMDCSLMLDVCFLLFAISNLLTSIGYCVPYIFLPNRATVDGMTAEQGAWLISIIGISNTVGRVIFGFIADYKWVNRLLLYNTALVLCGVLSLLSAACVNFPLMAAYAASFGLFIGVYICLTPIVIVDLLGLDKLSNAFGIVLLFQGIGTVVGPPVVGAVYDYTLDYNNSFYLMGICIAVSGAMLYFIPCIKRCQRSQQQQQQQQPTQQQQQQQQKLPTQVEDKTDAK